MRTCRWVDLIHVFLTSTLLAGELPASRPGRFIARERIPVTGPVSHWMGGWVGPRTGLDDLERIKILLTLVPHSRIFLPWRWRRYVPRTSVHTTSTRLHIPEGGILHNHRCEKFKSYEFYDITEIRMVHIRKRRFILCRVIMNFRCSQF
jgi:hypothetical protein